MSSNIYDKQQKKLIPFAGNSEATAGSLDGLSDVSLSSPTDGQVLIYDAENQVWKNGAGATVIESLGDIADVDLTDLEDGQTIIWDAVEQKWIPGESGSDYLAGFGINIDANNRVKTTDFVGTQAEWDALTPTQKESYDFVHITDDSSDVSYSPGHAISDGTTEKTQREVLEFEGFTVTDDSVNGKTKVAEIPYTAGEGIEIDANKEVTTDPDLLPFTFIGTKAEWEGLTTDEKAQYKLVNLTDDVAGGEMYVEDAVTEDSTNPVTSGAVYERTTPTEVVLTDVNSMVQGSVRAYVVNDIITIEFFAYSTVSLPAATWTVMATIPEGYRLPTDYSANSWYNVSAPIIVGRGGQMGEIRVHENGIVSAYTGTATSSNALVGSVSYRLHNL